MKGFVWRKNTYLKLTIIHLKSIIKRSFPKQGNSYLSGLKGEERFVKILYINVRSYDAFRIESKYAIVK